MTRPAGRLEPYAVPAAAALAKLAIHLPVLHRFGWHHDELYFVACGEHLSFGYVDHAPLVPWIARLATTLFGDSLWGLRLFASVAGAVTLFLACVLTRRLGGGRFAQAVTGAALLSSLVGLRTGHQFAIPSFEPLFWVTGALLLVRIVQGGSPRLWLWLGGVAGLGLLNKHSMLFFVFGLGVGLLVTPLRRHLRTRWPWWGGALALALLAPNLVWQVRHGWPTAGFLRDLHADVMAGISPVQFLAGQVLYLNPLAAFVWIGGLWSLCLGEGRPFRILGVIWLSVFLLLLLTDSKIYYLAPAYPPILAGGGVALERWAALRRAAWRPVLLGLPLAGLLLLGPVAVPYLSIRAIDRYMERVTFGAMDNIYELTGDLHGMFGWPERVEAVAEVWSALPAEEREGALLLARWYGTAGAIDLLGPDRGLPPAVSWDKTYWMWADPSRPLDLVVAVDLDVAVLERIWAEVEVVESLELADVNPWETPFRIALCRRPRLSMEELWPQVRPW